MCQFTLYSFLCLIHGFLSSSSSSLSLSNQVSLFSLSLQIPQIIFLTSHANHLIITISLFVTLHFLLQLEHILLSPSLLSMKKSTCFLTMLLPFLDLVSLHMNGGQNHFMALHPMALVSHLMVPFLLLQTSLKLFSKLLHLIGPFGLSLDLPLLLRLELCIMLVKLG